MKLSNKFDQEILEILSYQDGPCVYGFAHKEQDFLASKISENEEGSRWLIIPLTSADLGDYENLKSKATSLSTFLKSRSGYVVEYDLDGDIVEQNKLSLIAPELIKSYEIDG